MGGFKPAETWSSERGRPASKYTAHEPCVALTIRTECAAPLLSERVSRMLAALWIALRVVLQPEW